MKTFSDFITKNATPTPTSTLVFAKKSHEGQKYGNEPYWTHVKAVADAGKKFFGSKFGNDAYMAGII